MDRVNAVSWVAVGAAVAGFAIYTAANHRGLTAPVPARVVATSPAPESPRDAAPLSSPPGFKSAGQGPKGWVTYSFIVNNFGTRSLTISSLGRNGPGMQLIRGSASPATVRPQDFTTVTVTYWITDCAAVTRASWPMPVTFNSAGRQSTQFLDVGSSSPDVPWQINATDVFCHPLSAP